MDKTVLNVIIYAMYETGTEACSLAQEDTRTLSEHAEGLNRADVMKFVVGPALTELLLPVYETPFDELERGRLPLATTWRDAENLAQYGVNISKCRSLNFRQQSPLAAKLFSDFDDLINKRKDLFNYDAADIIIEEGLETGIKMPFNVATHVFRLENEAKLVPNDRFDHKSFSEILARDSLRSILYRLTKGPNGFLGPASIGTKYAYSDYFLSMGSGDMDLSTEQAYTKKNGQVVDLSVEYHRAAQNDRGDIKEKFKSREDKVRHRFGDSSGCPVRHDRLISAGKDFLAALVNASYEKTNGHQT